MKSRIEEVAGANVRAAWAAADGAGIVVGISDDGVQHTHEDLQPNYSAGLSYDFFGGDPDPSPDSGEAHGTRVAGAAAARGGNAIGVSGVAPLATIAGLRLGPTLSDPHDAAALNHLPQNIHIVNASWGPPPDANLVAPGPMTEAALQSATALGRGGLGRVFTWAAGNGFGVHDCNQDGYANSRFVVAVAAVADNGLVAPYSEACAANLVSAPSNGGSRGITTTTVGGYTSSFGGTSAAAPIVAGVAALMLQRNPQLTWRDVQHILVRSSVKLHPGHGGWSVGGPFSHHHDFGFGLVDAQAAANLAATWTNVGPEFAVPAVTRQVFLPVPDNDTVVSDSIVIGAQYSNVQVEHIEVEFSATHQFRRDFEIVLTSPVGVESILAPAYVDQSPQPNYSNWRFRSVRHWGESAAGTWTLRVRDRVSPDSGTFNSWTLRIYGSGSSSSAVVTADSVSPNAGSGSSQTFQAKYSDSLGAADLAFTYLRFATSPTGPANTCMVRYDRASGLLALRDNAGNWLPGVAPGTPTTQENSQCSVNIGGSSTSMSGNVLTLNAAMTFKPAYGGLKNIYLFAQSQGGVVSEWQQRGTWTVPSIAVNAVSVSPNAGSGATQAFTLQYTDSAGATDLSSARVRFGASNVGPGTCTAWYNAATARVQLLGNDGVTWSASVPLGSGTLANGQCTLNLASSTATAVGTSLTVVLNITFDPSFTGLKNIYMLAASQGTPSANTGWVQRGTWTPHGATVVSAVSVSPNAGSGATQAFTLQYTDSAGATDLSSARVRFGASNVAPGTCTAWYNAATATVQLLGNDGVTWSASVPLGSGTLANGQCTLNLASSMATAAGTSLTLVLNITFAPSFTGLKNIYMLAASQGTPSANTGWLQRGTWTPHAVFEPAVVNAVSVSPNAGSGATQAFTLQYTDSAGATDLSSARVRFGASNVGPGTCTAWYNAATATVQLLGNDGVTWSASVPLGSGTLANGQCTLNLASSVATAVGTSLTLVLNITFAPSFTGLKNIYMLAASQGTPSANTGWLQRGTWTPHLVPGPAVVNAVSVSPDAGSGATQAFTLQYTDSAGGADLSSARVRFGASNVGPGTCTAWYNAATATVQLLGNDGVTWSASVPLGSGTLANSQCTLNLASSTAAVNGTNLTLVLNITFQASFNGLKNVYMLAASQGTPTANTGWQQRGTFTVNVPAAGSYDGNWSGTNSHLQAVLFTVTNGQVTSFVTSLPYSGINCFGSTQVTASSPATIVNGSATVSLFALSQGSGTASLTFSSPTSMSGNLTVSMVNCLAGFGATSFTAIKN